MTGRSVFLISPSAFIQHSRTVLVGPPAGPGSLFRLAEYESSFSEVLQEELQRLAEKKAPLLAKIRTEKVEAVRVARVTTPSGETLKIPPYAASFEWTVDVREVLDCDLTAFTKRLHQVALQHADAQIDHLLHHTTQIADAFGNSQHADGQPLTWSILLRILSQLPLDFDQEGNPELPLLVDSWNRRAITPYPPLDEKHQEAFKELIDRKRQEFNARPHRR